MTTNTPSTDEVNLAINELCSEASSLFSALDDTSSKIRDLEKKLSDTKTHFPYRYLIKEAKGNVSLPIEQRHFDYFQKTQQNIFDPLRYKTIVSWYLAWEPINEDAKEFRLFFLSIDREWIIWNFNDPQFDELAYESETLKRPLIELKLSERLQIAEHLYPFILAFKEFLKTYRISITREPPF